MITRLKNGVYRDISEVRQVSLRNHSNTAWIVFDPADMVYVEFPTNVMATAYAARLRELIAIAKSRASRKTPERLAAFIKSRMKKGKPC